MTSAVRAGVTAGIALVSSGVMVAAPAVAPPPDIEVRAVELTAGLFDPYIDLVTNTFNNLVTIGAHWLEDPLPVLTQVIVNWYDYVQTTIKAIFAAGQSFIAGLENLPDQLHTLFDALSAGDYEQVAAELILIGISINPLQGLAHALLAIPYDIVGNYVGAAFADLHALQVPVGLAVLTAAHATIAEVGVVVHDFFSDLQNGNLWAAFVQLVDAPAQILNAALNSDAPGQAGLLTPFQDLNQTGFVDALLNYLRQAVAHAIGAPDIPINAPSVSADALADPVGNLNLDQLAAVVPPQLGDLSDFGALLNPVADATSTLADVAP